ncbi:FadR/GntR family transcriptional regulator [Streptomyces sp. SDT5-1]|uniref:FadR/GntR family transcriptional regulator n=1 Tax=Streptomyces sp. SDT5-1 TaxID=3406418 RepID=UPI003FD527FA
MSSSVEAALRDLVEEGIRNGELRPGAKLPTERELVALLGAPRYAIRSGLASLEREGVLARQVGRGTFLTDQRAEGVVAAPADTSPMEIMQTRLALEPQIAPLAARSATRSDLDHVVHCLRRAEAASSTFAEFESWDAQLHRAITLAAHNGLLLRLFDTMNAARSLAVWGDLKSRTSTPERRQLYQADHHAIVDALLKRDQEAARTRMCEHIIRVSDHLFGHH